MKQHTASEIVFKSTLSTRARVVFMYLSYRSNKENTCFPAIKTISRECGMGVSTVKRALSDLCDEGYIKKDSRYRDDNGQTSNLYTLMSETPIEKELEIETQEPIQKINNELKNENEISDPIENKNSQGRNGSEGVQFKTRVKFEPGSMSEKQQFQSRSQQLSGREPPPSPNCYSHELVKANSKIKEIQQGIK
jgi:predicted transcriptional regulator